MQSRRAVALMLALWLIVVIGGITAAIAAATRDASTLVSNLRAEVVSRYAAESGIAVGKVGVEKSLERLTDTAARQSYLNSIEQKSVDGEGAELGDSRMTIAYVDISSRLDVNWATAEQLTRFFEQFAGGSDATSAANAIRVRIAGENETPAFGGRGGRAQPASSPLRIANPIRSLEELRSIGGIPEKLLDDAAPYLTVDGDGRINRVTASDTVLAGAAGELENEPSRILIVARGWLNGQRLTHEIQAVYGIEGNRLVLVRWRERDL